MPAPSAVDQLPEDVRKDLEQMLIRNAFSGYQGLAEWLQGRGFEISKSSVHRFGKEFKDRLRALKVATDQAKAIAEASEDDAGLMNDALIRLVQTKTFELLIELNAEDKKLPKIGHMIADLARAAVSQKKLMKEVDIRRKALEDAAGAVDAAAKQAGISEDTILKIRRDVLRMGD